MVIAHFQRDLPKVGDVHHLIAEEVHRLTVRHPGGDALEGDSLGLELIHQAVQTVQRRPREGLAGEVGRLNPLKLLLDLNDGLQIAQRDGGAVHISHLAQVGGRVLQQLYHLVQGVGLPVQIDGIVCLELSVFVQQAQLLQKRVGLGAVSFGQRGKLVQNLLILSPAVGQQVAHRGIGRGRQHGQRHTYHQQQAE